MDASFVVIAHHVATNGDLFPEDAPAAFTYNGPGGAVDTVTKAWAGASYRLTYAYSGDSLVSASGWVKV